MPGIRLFLHHVQQSFRRDGNIPANTQVQAAAAAQHPGAIRELIAIIDDGTVSNNQAKDVFAKMWDEPALAAAQAAKLLGFEKADSSFLDGIVREVISANPDKVAEIQGGNEKLLNWLTGQVMKAAKGKANPKIVTEALKKALSME